MDELIRWFKYMSILLTCMAVSLYAVLQVALYYRVWWVVPFTLTFWLVGFPVIFMIVDELRRRGGER